MDSLTAIEQIGVVWIATLKGEVDAYTAPALRRELRRLIEEKEATVLVVDLAAVTFLDSSGLGALVGALRRLRERDGGLLIVVPRNAAARIFELTGLDRVLDLHQTREGALAAAVS